MPSRCYCAFCPHLLFLHRLMFCWCCSEVGGQHTDHYHRLSCGRSHCINNGLHAAQELYSLCSFQAWGEKVSKIQVLSVTTADCHPGALFFILKLLNSNFLSPPPPTPLHCSKECLVPSSGIDNTENGLSGSKAATKPTPKKKWESACQITTTTIMSVYFLGMFSHFLCSQWDLITGRGPSGVKYTCVCYNMQWRVTVQMICNWFLWLAFSIKSTVVHLEVVWISVSENLLVHNSQVFQVDGFKLCGQPVNHRRLCLKLCAQKHHNNDGEKKNKKQLYITLVQSFLLTCFDAMMTVFFPFLVWIIQMPEMWINDSWAELIALFLNANQTVDYI